MSTDQGEHVEAVEQLRADAGWVRSLGPDDPDAAWADLIDDVVYSLRRVGWKVEPQPTQQNDGPGPVLCAHADRNGEGMHWLQPGERCTQQSDGRQADG